MPQPDHVQRLPRPAGHPLMRMQWKHLLFMHWRIEASQLRPLIPAPLDIDEHDGSAWVGLIPFTMRDVLPAFMPAWPIVGDIPAISAFHECNVRTYVTYQGEPGVWFFSLDAASRPAVWAARHFFHLPYFFASMHLSRQGELVNYAVDRVHSPHARMRCVWKAGDPLPRSQPGDLAYFLTERYALYAVNPSGDLYRLRIVHEPWALRSASLVHLQDQLVHAAGINLDQSQPPRLHHANVMTMLAWPMEKL